MNQTVPFVTSGSYPTRSGNQIRPLIDGIPAFRRICGAIETAQQCVWATITFMWPSVEMPDNYGTPLEVFERAAQRGVDVRLIFWRPEERMEKHKRNAFWGPEEHFDMLAREYPSINIRWDRGAPGYCQHQKTWLIDPTDVTGTSFVGGINLNPHAFVMPGHSGRGAQFHDVYVELSGPAVSDVQHNFVQRWNEASERSREDGRWGENSAGDLTFPTHLPDECGTAQVQIQRTTRRGLYENGHPAADGGRPFDIAAGERTNLDQYCSAIRAANRTIYMENQYVEVTPIVEELEKALKRGIEVAMVLPITPDLPVGGTITDERRAFLDLRAKLDSYDNFTLAGLAALGEDGSRQSVYVHSKVLLIDDNFASIGSCNLHHHSLYGNGELNAAIFCSKSVKAIRVELFNEHVGVDTSPMNDTHALRTLKMTARENRKLHKEGVTSWQGLVVSMRAAAYGQEIQF
ncbi:MAG: phosphatidylserine/phosphatidylglycerophosphate/cardiolipin synthase family protein [Gammaproteobacteria bacterium]|nr:phosphatidylserine/phosphatidylglycerophosphate/cardiolipin synthase family protein [Gammaproteobacteria bacterium]